MNSSGRWQVELGVALSAVRAASALCRQVAARGGTQAISKDDRSPVTVADLGSQALICAHLRAALPHDAIVAEEDAGLLLLPTHAALRDEVVGLVGARLPDRRLDGEGLCALLQQGRARSYSPRFWTLDPIDGTKGFLRGGQYAVALALVVEGQVELAVLGCPNMHAPGAAGGAPAAGHDGGAGTLFYALRGDGAWGTALDGDGGAATRLHVSDRRDPTQARICESVEAAHSAHGEAASVATRLGVTAPPVRMDSQAKYAAVALGAADVYLRLPTRADYREKIWDHAAGLLIVREAGGQVTDVTGRPLDFRCGAALTENRGVIATNGHLHADVLRALSA